MGRRMKYTTSHGAHAASNPMTRGAKGVYGLLAFVALIEGCSVGPKYKAPPTTVRPFHNPAPMRIGGHGSACGSLGALIFATASLACLAAAATSSGNCASALSSPARRANSSTIVLSMMMTPSINQLSPLVDHCRGLVPARTSPMLRFLEHGQKPAFRS